jgi:hypothetical protein
MSLYGTGSVTDQDMTDYRGRHVMQTVRTIAVSNWPIATKIDI